MLAAWISIGTPTRSRSSRRRGDAEASNNGRGTAGPNHDRSARSTRRRGTMLSMRSIALTVRRATRPGQIAALVAGIAGLAGGVDVAAAHVAPSVGDNN